MTTTSKPNGDHPNAGRFVRSETDAEYMVATDRFYRNQMRGSSTQGHAVARVAIRLCQRGYAFPHDITAATAVALEFLGDHRSVDACRKAADKIIEGQLVSAEPGRDELVAMWDTMFSRVGDDPETAGDEEDYNPRERVARQWRYAGMQNRAMRDKLERGECVDLSSCRRTEGVDYVVPEDVWQEDVDYCNAETEDWIWSIGRSRRTGQIYASHSNKYYQNPQFECLFLR